MPAPAPDLPGLLLRALGPLSSGLLRLLLLLPQLAFAAHISPFAFSTFAFAFIASEGLVLPLARALAVPSGSEDQGAALLRLVLLGAFLFLLCSGLLSCLRFVMLANGFTASFSLFTARHLFLLLPGQFCRQFFLLLAKLALARDLRWPQLTGGCLAVVLSLLLLLLLPPTFATYSASYSAGYAAALLIEIGCLCCCKNFRELFDDCSMKQIVTGYRQAVMPLFAKFSVDFAETALLSVALLLIGKHSSAQLVTAVLLVVTNEAATWITRAFAAAAALQLETDPSALYLASGLVLLVGSFQSLFIFNLSSDIVTLFSSDKHVAVFYKSSLFGFLSFVLVTSFARVWRARIKHRCLAIVGLLVFSRWIVGLGLAFLLAMLVGQNLLFCLPITLPLGAVVEAAVLLITCLNLCEGDEKEEERLFLRATEEKEEEEEVERSCVSKSMRICAIVIASLFSLLLVIYGCVQL